MKLNWLCRLRNKTTLIQLLAAIITFVYLVLGLLGITPKIAQDQANQLALMVVNILWLLGIVIDPTTKGVSDSEQALNYETPAPNVNSYVE